MPHQVALTAVVETVPARPSLEDSRPLVIEVWQMSLVERDEEASTLLETVHRLLELYWLIQVLVQHSQL